jgi:hypothetical protein
VKSVQGRPTATCTCSAPARPDPPVGQGAGTCTTHRIRTARHSTFPVRRLGERPLPMRRHGVDAGAILGFGTKPILAHASSRAFCPCVLLNHQPPPLAQLACAHFREQAPVIASFPMIISSPASHRRPSTRACGRHHGADADRIGAAMTGGCLGRSQSTCTSLQAPRRFQLYARNKPYAYADWYYLHLRPLGFMPRSARARQIKMRCHGPSGTAAGTSMPGRS